MISVMNINSFYHSTGQWIDTWYPKANTKEICILLEDDVDISAHSLRWLKLVHSKYDARNDLAG